MKITYAIKNTRALDAYAHPNVLRPWHLGKNADQIQRLFKSPAEVFLVQYHGEIDQMVVAEMETHARDLARKEEQTIWFGAINGQDSRRLMAAYASAFRGD